MGNQALEPLCSSPHPPASNERLHSQSGRQDKRTLHFLSLQGKHLVLKTTPPVPGSFKVQHLEDNLWIFIRNILTIQQGWGLLGLCIHKHLPPHTHKHTIVWSAKVLIYDHLPKWISTYSTHPSYPVYKHFSTSARTLTEQEHRTWAEVKTTVFLKLTFSILVIHLNILNHI